MRKRYRVLIFASLVAALVVPVGYALSVESLPAAAPATKYATMAPARSVIPPAAAAAVVAPITLRTADTPAVAALSTTSDAAKLFGIGTQLFGLAAFVRKAI